jgi:uncharacterized protein YrzB (UPF0473 family)
MDQTITVYDNDGKSKEFQILFTYDDETTRASYVFYYDALDEGQIFVSKYDEQGHLFPIEDPDEWDAAEEILASYDGHQDDRDMEVCEECGKE